MKKVIAIVGSAHKKNTHKAAMQFLDHLQALGEVECEIVTLSDYNLKVCRGCRVCFEKGESFCPLKDDRDVLMTKIDAANGVIFASPNYSFHMSGIMKVFLDRLGFAIHRPRYYGKAFTSIVSQGFGGGKDIIKNFDFVASTLGFSTLKGTVVTGFDPKTEQQELKIDRALARQSKRFYALLTKPALTAPSFLQLMIFRMGRSTIRQQADPDSLDYHYYADKGWLDSDYYYPTRLGPFKKAAGKLLDSMTATLQNFL